MESQDDQIRRSTFSLSSTLGYSQHLTVKIARLAVQTGAFLLLEVRKGKVTLNIKRPRLAPIQEYTKTQARFSHLTDSDIKELQQRVSERYSALCQTANSSACPNSLAFLMLNSKD